MSRQTERAERRRWAKIWAHGAWETKTNAKRRERDGEMYLPVEREPNIYIRNSK